MRHLQFGALDTQIGKLSQIALVLLAIVRKRAALNTAPFRTE
jgi:hypothetical protein